MKKVKLKIATIDFETDPFKFGRVPKPFVFGFYNKDTYFSHWGNDCVKVLMELLEDLDEPHLIYAHNGGKFDFLYFIEKFAGSIRIVNGRILEGRIGKHILRDSYGILPIRLAEYDKGDIDYKLLESDVRDLHREEIETYLKRDCVSLHELIEAFVGEFGDVLTIGSASMKAFKSFHQFETGNKTYDSFFRQYYFGGRCQCFETGVIDMPLKIYDVNSMYPHVMDKMMHPISVRHEFTEVVTPESAFVCWEGINEGAVPVRTKFGLDFTIESGTFWSTIHEFNAGLDTGLIRPKRIKHAVQFAESMKFSDFVNHFYESRQIAKKNGDKFHDIFYKLILNSSYGKFAQNPEHYQDSIILPWGEIAPEPYELEYRHDQYAIWSKPTVRHSYYNVATAASITGAARSLLLRGIASAVRPLYCDTDSVICRDMQAEVDSKKLGAWKEEATGTQIAIGGKKLYAVMDGDICVKKASKGVNLPPLAIFQIARGETIEARNEAPSFKLGSPVTYNKEGMMRNSDLVSHQFIERNVRRTG